jgi:hypothetical protein
MQATRFSRRTVLAAIDVLEQMTHAEFDRYLRGLGTDTAHAVAGQGVSLRHRLNSLIDLIDAHPDRCVDGRPLAEELVEKAATFLEAKPSRPWSRESTLSPQMEAFQRALALDGFDVHDRTIHRSLPTDIGLPGAHDTILELLKRYQLTTAQGHLIQALDAHGRGDWAAANSQIRCFLDAMLDEVAVRIDPTAAKEKSGNPRCTKLAANGFLLRDLNEWEDSGKGFINGLRNRLHPQGAHPGLSDEEDSTFRLHAVLITVRLLLRRFDRRGSA